MFVRRGRVSIAINKSVTPEVTNETIDNAIENNAEEINEVEGLETEDSRVMEVRAKISKKTPWILWTPCQFICSPEFLGKLEGSFRKDDTSSSQESPLISVISSELVYLPREVQDIEGEQREQVEELVRELEANSDTSRVWTSTSIRTQP